MVKDWKEVKIFKFIVWGRLGSLVFCIYGMIVLIFRNYILYCSICIFLD